MVCTGVLLHPLFFVIMGDRRNFATMLLAYVFASLARSVLSGTSPPGPVCLSSPPLISVVQLRCQCCVDLPDFLPDKLLKPFTGITT